MARPKVLIVDDNRDLLNILARLFEDAGYEVLPAGLGKQAIELAQAQKPDLAVLDILLPDMMGYHVAEALRLTANVPLLFMTGVFRGGRHAAETKAKFGSAGYFEKPFVAGKLLETARSLVPPGEKPAPEAAADPFDLELDIDVEEERPQDPLELTGFVRVTGEENITAELRGAPLVATGGRPGAATIVRPPPASHPDAPAPIAASERGTHRGELRDNLPSLITAFYLSQETGELGVQHGKVKKVIYFENGKPVFAQSNLVTDRFGQFLVRVGKLKGPELVQATVSAAATGRRTGQVLLEMGVLKHTERLYYVGQQVRSIIYSIFGWEDGVYQLAFRRSAQAEPIKLDIHPANLIMRGVKKLYRPERLRRLLAPEDRILPSMQPPFGLEEITLEKWEAVLLPKVDGTRTVAELTSLAAVNGRTEYMVHAFLYSLVALSVFERRA